MSDLAGKRCLPCEGGIPALSKEAVQAHLQSVKGWQAAADYQAIIRKFRFDDFYQTMAFVNAVAWIANQENHHPDLEVGYNYCNVRYNTHAVHGVTENDFICAAKINNLVN